MWHPPVAVDAGTIVLVPGPHGPTTERAAT